MVRHLINRPVAVFVCFAVALMLGFYVWDKIPMSLLPEADIPEITVKIDYPNTTAQVMEQNIVRPIRENLSTLPGVSDIQSSATNHTANIFLRFEYNTRMDLALIEVNEKIDRLTEYLPREMPRPQIVRASPSDLPIVRIQVIPLSAQNMFEMTNVCEHILKPRFEQLPGVSRVDMNGGREMQISVSPKMELLAAYKLTASDLTAVIANSNAVLGNISLRDGQYRYFIRVLNNLAGVEDLQSIAVPLSNGNWVKLGHLAEISANPVAPQGYHLYNGNEGIVITIQKNANSRLNNVLAAIADVIKDAEKEYPQVHFATTQNQNYLLEAGIENLTQDLIFGGAMTILLLFAFLGNWRSPFLMSISIPVSLVLTFVLFKVFNISFNIISLSGLTLGIGTLIDNTIVVVDNIIRRRKGGLSAQEAAIAGTHQVMVPVLSQVLTTVAVYAPLVILSGLAGILVLEQGIALTISLFVSLTVAFILAPLIYTFLFKSKKAAAGEDTRFYKWVNKSYHKLIYWVMRYRAWCFAFTLMLMPIGILIGLQLPVKSLPPVEQFESQLRIDWNAPVDASQNMKRVATLMQTIQPHVLQTEADAGISRFVLKTESRDIQKATVYYQSKSEADRKVADSAAMKWFSAHYPTALVELHAAPNVFTQLFLRNQPFIEARFHAQSNEPGSFDRFADLLARLPVASYKTGMDRAVARILEISVDQQALQVYGISNEMLNARLTQLLGATQITNIERIGNRIPVVWQSSEKGIDELLENQITSSSGISYPIKQFITLGYGQQPKNILADKSGVFHSLIWEDGQPGNIESKIEPIARNNGWQLTMRGSYIEDRQLMNRLWLIGLLVLFLIYVILVIQYESLTMPIIVMLTIPIGITAAMTFLWLTGSSLNVMAAIGFIVILGLIVDDPVLKIETLNRLEKKYLAEGRMLDEGLLMQMIHEAGDICLKPLLLVSLTTSSAMLPVLFIPGIGNDLQKPMAIVVISGLTVGTFFTTWFIPLAFWYSRKWKIRKINMPKLFNRKNKNYV